MTGREKIEAAFSTDGTREVAAVIPYQDIFIRDHWDELTSCPWWYAQAPEAERQLAWRREVIDKAGQDWFGLPVWLPRKQREGLRIEARPDGVFRVDTRTGEHVLLTRPRVGGWAPVRQVQSVQPERLAETTDEIDALIPAPWRFDPDEITTDGRGDLAAGLLKEFGNSLYPIWRVSSPLWCCYGLWGFEGMMTMIGERPDLVQYACERFLALAIRAVREAALLGAAGVWIEECMTDMISPEPFRSLNVPFLAQLVEQGRVAGLKSIYYFCGSPAGKWDQIISVGADAIAMEEGKKGFEIDINRVVAEVRGRCTVLGNLDAVRVLQDASEEHLRTEIARQIAAGRRNGGRFVMSLGSPVTPGTSVESVRLYCDLIHELARA